MLTCQRDREHTALGALSLKYTVLWALSSAMREEKRLEPAPGKTQKSQPQWERALTKLQTYARSPSWDARCCWVLKPSSGEGVGRHNVSDTKDAGSPVKGVYQTHLHSNREHLLYPPSTQVFLTSHGHPSWARYHQDSDSARQTPGLSLSSCSLGGLIFLHRGTSLTQLIWILKCQYLRIGTKLLGNIFKWISTYLCIY